MDPRPELCTVAQVAEILQVHEKTVRRWINEGRLPVVRIGRLVRIPSSALDELAGSAA